ncbi:MAG: hypothetical protein H6745_33825 [Deltaproteobacteria bacterium]|nr:hypothetical protein [Deltaproteobacteria bacterium]
MRTNLDSIPTQTALHGRETALDALDDWFASPLASAALIGAPGVGKTAVLRAFGAACAAERAGELDEIWWCDVRGVTTLEGLLARLAAVTGAAADDVGDVIRSAMSLLGALTARGRVLLLLDGVDTLVVQDRGRLPAEVFDATRVRWVLSSRVTTGIADRRIYLGPLDPDAAVAILEESAQRAGAEQIEAAPGEMAALAEQLDNIPLALELGGQWLATLTPQQLSAALARHASFLAEDDHASGLQLALTETWARAEAEDRAAITALCALETDFSVELAAAVWGTSLVAAARRLRRLQWLSLVWASSDGGQRRFTVYMAVRGYGLQSAAPAVLDDARERAARWLADHFETWDLDVRRAEALTLQAAFDWAIVARVPLAARLALASLSMAEDGDAFAARLRQLSLALERAVDSPDREEQVVAQLYHAIGRGHLLARDAAGALEALEHAAALAATGAAGLRARVSCALAQTRLLAGDLDAAYAEATRTLELADPEDAASRVEAGGVLAFLHAERLEAAAAQAAYEALRRDAEWRGRAAELALADAFAFGLVALTEAVEQLTASPRVGASPRAIAEYWHRRAETMLALGDLPEAERSYRAIVEESGLRHDVRLTRATAGGLAAARAVADGGAVDPLPLAELTRYYETGDWRFLATRARLHWGVALALAGQPRAGWRQLERALADAHAHGMIAHLLAFHAVARVVAHLAGLPERMPAWPAQSPAGVPRGAGPLWLRHSLALADAWVAGAPLPAFDGRERWSQRAIRRLAAAADRPPTDEGALSPDGPRLEIGPDWRWFRVGDDPPVSLTRRNSGRRILQHLVGIARDAPATVVTRDELLEIGWPGERMMAESGFARVHTTLWRLRQLGLGEVLVSEEDGYRLRDDVEVVGA